MKNLSDKCRCFKKNKFVTLEKCLNGLVDATAFKKTFSDCFECPHGMIRRNDFCVPASPDDEVILLPRNQVRKKFRRFNN